MTDPQTAADAAERCPVPCDDNCDAVCHATHDPSHKRTHHWPEDCPAADQYDWGTSYANAAVIRLRKQRAALLAERARMAAELEQVRELVELLRRARAKLHLERDQAREELEQFRGSQLEWAVLHVSGRDGPLSEADALRFAAQAAPAGARLQNRAVGKWRDASATSAAPDATGDTQAAERRADGLRDLTKLEGPQRGSQGDAVCDAYSHPDFGDVVPCELPDGHRYHRNGTREWMP